MKHKNKIILNMQGLVLLVLIPALLVVTALLGWVVYTDLYSIIMAGFDRKLMAVSSVVGSFVQPDDLQHIAEFRQIRGLAWDDDSRTLYGNYFNEDRLRVINPDTGTARYIDIPGIAGMEDLAWSSASGVLYSARMDDESEVWSLYEISPAAAGMRVICELPGPCYGLTWSEQDNCLYGAGDVLLKIDPVSGTAEELTGELGGVIRGLAWDTARSRLLGVNMGANTIVQIDTTTGETIDVSRLTVVRANGEKTPLKTGTYGLAMDRGGQLLYGASTIDVLDISAADFSCRQIAYTKDASEMRGELYRRYLMPMIAIRERCGLTYNILGELVDDAQYINYIIDSTQDETVEYVGWVDDFEPVEEGLRDVWFKGDVFLSMYYWEEWGLMKSAYVPIETEKGHIVGFSGADINISLIEKKTRDALVSVLLISALSLIFAVIMSLFISRKLIEPMRNLMDMALKVAAGKFGEQIVLTRPREIFNISNRFNTMSSYIRDVLNRISDESLRFERLRRSRELVRIMNAKIDENVSPVSGQCSFVWNDTERAQISGACVRNGLIAVYLGQGDQSAFQAVRHRFNIHSLLYNLLDTPDPRKAVSELIGRDSLLGAILLVEQQTGQVYYVSAGDRKTVVYVRKGDTMETIVLQGEGELRLEAGSMLLATSGCHIGACSFAQDAIAAQPEQLARGLVRQDSPEFCAVMVRP